MPPKAQLELAGGATAIQLKFPVAPACPFVSNTSRHVCVPAFSHTPAVTVVYASQPPVVGTVNGPVMSVPFASIWNVPPAPSWATRTLTS